MYQPYDRVLKQITAKAARRLLDIAGILSEQIPVILRPLEREVAGPALRTDQLFHYNDGCDWTIHFEFEAQWRTTMPERLTRYQKVITLEYPGVEVNSVVFVLRPDGCPAADEYSHREGRHSPVTEIRYRVVRLWELDPAGVLAGVDEELLPVAAIMASTDEQVLQVRSRVAGDPERMAQMLALLAIRYDKEQIEAIFGDHPMFTKEILKHSWMVREVMADSRQEGRLEGRVEGRLEGREEGRTYEARAILRRYLNNRFPDLEIPPELDLISGADVLESVLMECTHRDMDRDGVIVAIRRAAGKY